jgi:low affinity Fe/Cu permease
MHLKLDELLRATPRARNAFMDVEEEDLAEIAREKEIVDQDDPYPTQRQGRGWRAEGPRGQLSFGRS